MSALNAWQWTVMFLWIVTFVQCGLTARHCNKMANLALAKNPEEAGRWMRSAIWAGLLGSVVTLGAASIVALLFAVGVR